MSTLIKPFNLDQARGMVLGMALGSVRGGSPEQQARGQWGAAASQALCMAQMLRSANGWDPEDVMRRFVNWRDFGYLSSTRVCFGLDETVAKAIERFQATGNPYGGVETSVDGGAIARLASVVVAYGGRVESASAVARLQARLTHGDAQSQAASAVVAEFMVTGESAVLTAVDTAPQNPSTVEDVLNAAIWALGVGDDFATTLDAACALGGVTELVGAVAGQLAGRRYGYSGLPADWLARLHDHDKILGIADDLHAMRPIDV